VPPAKSRKLRSQKGLTKILPDWFDFSIILATTKKLTGPIGIESKNLQVSFGMVAYLDRVSISARYFQFKS
jgi:hypothetical protein